MDNMNSSEKAQPFGRRSLTAIMFTDVVDSSRLMGDNEERMMALLDRDLRLISELCHEFEGRVLKSMGDGCLAIFDSGVHAVECAQEIQRYFAEQAQTLAENEVLLHRIGLHLGDIYINEDDVMGDGVNVAARLQSEASPGGICMSQALYEVVKTRLSLKTEYKGPKQLKNIREAVHLYQIIVSDKGSQETQMPSQQPPLSKTKARGGRKKLLVWGILAAVLILFIGAIFVVRARRKASDDVADTLRVFRELDRNDDHKLTPDEIPEPLRNRLMGADLNQDGAVDMPELQKAIIHLLPSDSRSSSQTSPSETQSPSQLFRRLDRDNDGKLEETELPERARERIMRADQNQDGVVTEAEFREALKKRGGTK